jgi:hypothetical protein
MKKSALVFALILLVLPGLADTPSDAPPEFYFTRLIYSGGRGGRFGGFGVGSEALRERECATLREGEGGSGNGLGVWATDYPASDCKYMWGVERLTNIRVYDRSPHSVGIMDPKLFEYPYLYAVEVGYMDLSQEEAGRLREYFVRGGFLHADDFWGPDQLENFVYQMEKVFPDRPLELLPLTHEVFHTFFDVDKIVQIPGIGYARRGGGATWQDSRDTTPRVYGVSDDSGRLMVMMTYNSDLGDAWEWMDDPDYPEIFSSQAYRMGINFIIYAMSH